MKTKLSQNQAKQALFDRIERESLFLGKANKRAGRKKVICEEMYDQDSEFFDPEEYSYMVIERIIEDTMLFRV